MKILHINSLLVGGAALCAQRISNALRNEGIDSRMLVAEGESKDYISVASADTTREDPWYSNPLKGKIKHLLMRTPWFWDEEKVKLELKLAQERTTERPYIHIPYSDYKNIVNHPLIEWADIIHLHWVSGMLDYPTFFKHIKKPIVWTLHDSHPAIGLLHYQSEFNKLPLPYTQVNKAVIDIKSGSIKKAKSRMHLVAISKMMQEICSQSQITKDLPTTLIHNGVDCSIFKPSNSFNIRNKYNISEDTIVFLFSSYSIWDKRKGLDRIITALEKLALPNICLICIGDNSEEKLPQTSFRTILTGKIDKQDLLAELYSASDFFIQASYEEAFAQTPLEAMACGIPVISTPCSGASDLIQDFNGIICQGFDAQAIAKGITQALQCKYNRKVIIEYIIKNYSYDIIANHYIQLYKKLQIIK